MKEVAKQAWVMVVFLLRLAPATWADILPASADPPGGLAASNTPQIICITFDDSVNANSRSRVQTLSGHTQHGGRPVPFTFFVSTEYTDYWLVHLYHAEGHEIAVHTMTHTTGSETDFSTWIREIEGCRHVLARYGNIPREDIRGFRAPFLKYGPAHFDALSALGFDYDSSVYERPGFLSADGGSLIWPYTLHEGLRQTGDTGLPPTNRLPDLVEVPMWCLLCEAGSYTMDPPGLPGEPDRSLPNQFHDAL
jgi:hypothetical protein